MWNNDPKEKNNQEAMLCPTSAKPDDIAAWNKILPIAVDAILNPNFMKDSNLDQVYHYTSDIDNKWGCDVQLTKVKIGSTEFLPKPKEMRLWKECS